MSELNPMIVVSSENLCDSTRTVISNATISFQPVLSTGPNTGYRMAGAAGGQVPATPVTAQAVAGVFSISLPDVSQTFPKYIGFSVTAICNLTGGSIPLSGLGCVQPTSEAAGLAWCTTNSQGVTAGNFDLYPPNLAPQVTVQTGPAGQSTYQAWIALGNTGSLADFVAAQKGADATLTTNSGVAIGTSGSDGGIYPGTSSTAIRRGSIRNYFGRAWMFFDGDGAVTATKDLRVLRNLVVSGVATLASLAINGTLSALGLAIGNATLTSGTDTTAYLTVKNNYGRFILRLLRSGVVQVGGNLWVYRDLTARNATLSGTLTVQGPASVNGLPVATLPAPQPIEGVCDDGQSNRIGACAAPILYPFLKWYGNLMPYGGMRAILTGGAFTSLVPIAETYNPPTNPNPPINQGLYGETGAALYADTRTELYRQHTGAPRNFVMANCANPGQTLAQLGTTPGIWTYDLCMQQWGSITSILGRGNVVVRYIRFNQGEADYNSSTYAADLLAYLTARAAGIKAQTGQTAPIKILCTQQSSTPTSGIPTPGSGVMSQPKQLMDAMRANPGVILVTGPTYDNLFCSDQYHQHIGNVGQLRAALRDARASFQDGDLGKPWSPLYILTAVRSGTVITVTFHVPVPPIVLDATDVQAIANAGFTYTNSGTAPGIVSVGTVPPDGSFGQIGISLYIQLASDPGTVTNEELGCGYVFPTGGNPVLGTGPRTNIRDSDTTMGAFAPNLYNWACLDQVPVTTS